MRYVGREQVILPRQTLDIPGRNILRFVEHRQALEKMGQSCRKGLLFYGPPGTGKTHTIHYLAALRGHTTLLISAEQVGEVSEYMTLARLLQPSMVVIEDADLIARERTQMQHVCEEVLLNKLLNEMDGLTEDADILFVLTTNRPEARGRAHRPARAHRSGDRVSLPDAEGRRKLVELYAKGAVLAPGITQEIVKRTANAAAFIRELMRRAAEFHLDRAAESGANGQDQLPDVSEGRLRK